MTELSDLQRRFSRIMGDRERMTGLTREALGLFATPHGASREQLLERLEVYHYAIHSRFVDALAEDFPVTRELLERLERRTGLLFEDWVGRYQREHPSIYRSLSRYGVDFARFLAAERRRLGPAAPWLAELARFEWEQVLSTFGPPAPPLDFATLGALTPAQWQAARFKLDPSVRLFESRWNIAPLLKPKPRLRAAPGAFRAVIYRIEGGPRTAFDPLDPLAFRVLDRLRRGARLGIVCAELPSESAARVMDNFAGWATRGIIRGISV